MCSKYHGHTHYYKDTMLINCLRLSHGDGSDGRHVCTNYTYYYSNYIVCDLQEHMSPHYNVFPEVINPRRACAARVTVVILCVCVCVSVSVCPGLASATHATTRPSRHTYGLSIVLAPESI